MHGVQDRHGPGPGAVDPHDRAEVHELLARYAEAVDDGDFEEVGRLFARATVRDAQGAVVAEGAEATARLFAATTRRHADGTPRTAHLVTNVVVDATGPDEVRVRSRFCVLQATDAVALAPVVVGRYDDTMVRDRGRWRFAERRMRPELWGDVSDHLTFDPRGAGAPAGAPSRPPPTEAT